MRRSPASALLALYPAVTLVVILVVPESAHLPYGEPGDPVTSVGTWWFALVVVTVIVHLAGFVWHAAARSTRPVWERALWIVGLLLASPMVAPLFWWTVADAT